MGAWRVRSQAGLDDAARHAVGTSAGPRSPRSPAAPARPTEGFGGVDGFVVGKDAPPETVEFLKYITSADVQRQIWAIDQPLPANRNASDVVTDPNQMRRVRGAGRVDVPPAVPRPVLHARSRRSGQRPDRAAVRRRRPRPRTRRPRSPPRWRLTGSPTAGGRPRCLGTPPSPTAVPTRTPMPHRPHTHVRPRRRRRLGRMPWSTVVVFLLPALVLYSRVPALPDRAEHPVQPLRLERVRAARRVRRARQLPRTSSAIPIPRRADATTSIIVVLSLLIQIPCALGAGDAAQREDQGAGHACARCSSPRTCCPRW